ncbi:MAG TPA: hypothetical protein VK171_15820 [Fimbriimonas sp.]|nr:hypothetical protein [Fimbriimonas sp.]
MNVFPINELISPDHPALKVRHYISPGWKGSSSLSENDPRVSKGPKPQFEGGIKA